MCGIAGFLNYGGGDAGALRATATAMSGSLRHRGPDDDGVWVDADAGVAFGFRRLSIIDLSAAGAQPMASATGRYVLMFNGEIYNHGRLRKQLEREMRAPAWRGHSDTEVMLAAIDAWGLPRAVERFIGMFAFALWDREERSLTLVRDRAGVKPLYVAATPCGAIFGSELRAVARHQDFRAEVDPRAAALYGRYGYVPAPLSIYRGARKLRPGSMMTFRAGAEPLETIWWDAKRVAESVTPFRGTEQEALEALDECLADSVALRMIADVPLGIFLSGGIDSVLVLAEMRRREQAVKTFTIGFDDPALDESDAAAAIARHFDADHTSLRASVDEACAVIPRLAAIYDEPFADTSAIPTFLVASLARQSVTVALSGDGGDELFGGYHRHFLAQRPWRRAATVPRPLRLPAAAIARRLPSRRMRYYAAALAGDVTAVHELNVGDGTLGGEERVAIELPRLDDPTEQQMFLDFAGYLPDDILVKVDRATMAVSLEAREPLLDHRLIELAWSLPLSMKVGGLEGKKILRRLLRRFLPPSMLSVEKKGFGLAVGGSLRGALRAWAESLLPGDGSFFDRARIAALWREHLAGTAHETVLWRVLMFEAWRRAAASAW